MAYVHTYAKIENEKITKLGPRPKWIVDDEPASDEVLRAGGFECDESGNPLVDDDGNYILATNSAEIYLPVIYDQPEHDAALQWTEQLDQEEWAIETKRVVVAYDIHDKDIDLVRAEALERATDVRWQVMTGGMTLPNGISVGTTIDDQNRITSVVSVAGMTGLTDTDEVDFKAASGWVRITIGEIKQIAGMIGQFVQACYTAERAHHDAINALETREELGLYDADVGWPEQTEDEIEPA